mmetsp:Transcript_10153/g.19218  ORF Transcript_10153/g.19218 Transcript_10153/m.19218 type:complete len:183 (+) Transcript_10153:87-635(+)
MGIAHGKEMKGSKKKDGGRNVLIPVDASASSEQALRWALSDFVKPKDAVHMVTFIADQSPFVRGKDNRLCLIDDAENLADTKQMKMATDTCKKFMDIANKEKASGTTYCEVVRYHPGSATSGVGPAIVHHASDTEADVIIVGSRGLGAVERSLSRPLGLGSVSDYTVHNSEAPVVVYKSHHK